ncbi:MAG: helix-turn-helix domain-containing protein [Zhaonellaceae bacterium]|jgi:transcriptional regulator of acetoin/glycerol metabolism|nr:hypothetical protein [Clostridia bacterium]
MEQVNREQKVELLKVAWQRFTEMGELMPGIRPVIARSWLRCKRYGLSSQGQPERSLHNTEDPGNYLAKLEFKEDILGPVLKETLTWLNSEAIILLIHNSSRTIMEVVGNLPSPFALFFNKGQLVSERVFGTFGPALALQGEKQIEVIGAEHYLAFLQSYHSVAAHFFINDEPWLLGAVIPMERSGPQTLGLLQAVTQILNLKLQSFSSYYVNSSTEKRDVIPLEQLEKMEVIKALKVCQGNITQSALMLGISRNALYNRIRKYNLDLRQVIVS